MKTAVILGMLFLLSGLAYWQRPQTKPFKCTTFDSFPMETLEQRKARMHKLFWDTYDKERQTQDAEYPIGPMSIPR